ncbi:MAG: energy transducer TonB [Alloprevotella sp.]|nr:energy transducer TonB [Alloprevotella sp.]
MNTIRILVACLLLLGGINSFAQVKEKVKFECNDTMPQYDSDYYYNCGIPAVSPAKRENSQSFFSLNHQRSSSLMKNHLTDTPAQFPGGEEALLDFLNKNIEYPDSELCDARTNPTVVVTFIVEKDGKICKDNVLTKISSLCPARDQAAIDVVKKLPDFIPARHHGESIPVLYTLPIRFCNYSESDYDFPFNVNVEVPAQFPGGEEALQSFIRKNLVYPVDTDVHGSVTVYFIVNTDGKVNNAFVGKGLSAECDQAALNLVKLFPDFIPAKHHGKNIAVIYRLQVNFYIL